jgi:hypothetical protein
MYKPSKKLTKKEREAFLKGIEEILTKCNVVPEIEVNWEVRDFDESLPFNESASLLTKCTNPKNFNFTINISGYGERK